MTEIKLKFLTSLVKMGCKVSRICLRVVKNTGSLAIYDIFTGILKLLCAVLVFILGDVWAVGQEGFNFVSFLHNYHEEFNDFVS